MRNKKIKIVIIAVFLTGLIIFPLFVFAESVKVTCKSGTVIEECETGGLIKSPECVCCGECDLTDALAVFIRVADLILKYVGVVALLMLIFGGILWMTSGGNESQIKKGKDVIKYTFLGIVIIFTAWIVVNFMIDKLVVDKSIFQGTWWGGKEDCSKTWPDCEAHGQLEEGGVWLPGCRHEIIEEVQKKLNQLNCAETELKIDICFGPQTSSALANFQDNYYGGGGVVVDEDEEGREREREIIYGTLDENTLDDLMDCSDSDICVHEISYPSEPIPE